MNSFGPDMLFRGFLYYMAFLFSTTCHEAAHALVAKWGGDSTAEKGGQVSLNPIPHIRQSPYGMVVFPLLSFFLMGGGMIGFASAPYDPYWARRHPHRAAWMALAGPATNFTLMILAAILLRIGTLMGWVQWSPVYGSGNFVTICLLIFFSLNLLLGVFNLLPVPPLDGSSAIMLFMNERQANSYQNLISSTNFAIPGLLVGLVVFKFVFPPIQAVVVRLLL